MTFCTFRTNYFRGKMLEGIPDDWIASIIRDPLEPEFGRRICYRQLPDAYGAGQTVVKVYLPKKKRRLLIRLKMGRAWREGHGYLEFQARGIQTVNLLFFGEERRFGLLKRGIVITQRVEAETVAKAYELNPRYELLERTADALARIHLAGLAHGDPRTRNFLATEPQPLTFDLPSWSFLTASNQNRDLVRFFGSAAATLGSEREIQRLIVRYRSPGLNLPVSERKLMHAAATYSQEKGRP